MAGCAGIKPDGSRCRGIATRSSDFCPAHDPARVEARRRSASKAARSKPNRALADLKDEVQDLIDRVLAGSVERGDASVALQGYNTLIRATDQERRLLEAQELEARMAEIEDAIEQSKTSGGWGRTWG